MLAISRGFKLKLALAVAIAALVCAAGGYWYFAFYIKTPEYAMGKLEKAIAAHDEKTALEFIDLDKFVELTTDDVAAGLLDDGRSLAGENRAALVEFVKIFRYPLHQSVKGLTLRYLRTGNFIGDDKKDGIVIDTSLLLRRTALDTVEWRGRKAAEKIAGDAEKAAICPLTVYQKATDEEFDLKLRLVPDEDGIYRLTSIDNLADFFALAAKKRHEQFANYLTKTDAINAEHDKAIAAIEQRMADELAAGSFGDAKTRQTLKDICEKELLADWQARREAIAALTAPDEGATLQRLYLKICEVNIAYANDYAAWLADKDAATIHTALQKQKEAKTLAADAAKIRQQIEINEGF